MHHITPDAADGEPMAALGAAVDLPRDASAPRSERAPYVAPVVQPLGHWQVHTLDTQSVGILRW